MEHSVCFIGHREIDDTPELRARVQNILLRLIDGGTVNFIFGDHSAFDRLCYETVTALMPKNPRIRRIRFRCDYEDADDYTMTFLLTGYEECVCPKGVGLAGRASYVERNRAMIRESEVCVFYFDGDYRPAARGHSGTASAFRWAVSHGKTVVNCFAN